MQDLGHLVDRLRRLADSRPPIEPLIKAAERSALTTNAQLRSAGIPARVEVRPTNRGVRLTMVQTGPITRRFSTPPMQVLRRNLVSGLPQVRTEIAEHIRQAMK